MANTTAGSIAIGLATFGIVPANNYLAAKRAPIPNVDKGKQDDIRISLPGYGEQIVKGWGRFRVAPTWRWHTPIVHSTIVTAGHAGGKGPPKPPTPSETVHIYSKNLAGVFHDGELQNVTRIWFDTDLVWNTENLSVARYEAESGTLGGTAAITAASYASNGAGVTHLGTGGGDNGYVDFAVTIDDSGDYDIAIYYQLDSGSQIFEVWLDGVLQGSVTCAGAGAGMIGIETIGFAMTAGAHTIRIGNTSTHAPNLDCIDIVETISFSGGSLTDSRIVTELTDPTVTPPTDETKPWPTYNARPLELGEDGLPLAGTSTLTATVSKGGWGNPRITIYRGTADQPADPTIIADKGVDNTPAWRGEACIVIEGLQLPNGALPNVTIECDQGTTDLDTIVEDIYALGGIDSSLLELSALSGLTVRGVIRTSQKPLIDTLRDLQTRFQFDMIEVDGVVKAVLRNRSTADVTIPYAKLRAHMDGEEMPAQDATITDMDPLLFPYRVDVNYLDPGQDYHNGVQSDARADGPQFDDQSVSLALVLDEHEAKKLASTLLYKPDMEGRTFSFTTGPEYLKVIPGSVVTLPLPNASHTVRITEAKYGLPAGVCSFTAVRQAPSIYSPTGFGTSGGTETPIAGFPSNTKLLFLDMPLLRAEDAGDGTQPVGYALMCGIGGGAWPGGFLAEEVPINSGSYQLLTTATLPSGIGVTSGTLATVSDPSVWDRTNTLTFQLYYDPGLSSASEFDLLNNPELNLIAVVNPTTTEVELVQFKTAIPATPDSPYVAKYTISTLLRGRNGTDNNVGTHTSADEVGIMDSTVKPRRYNLADIGRVTT